MSSLQQGFFFGLAECVPGLSGLASRNYREVYEEGRDRVYALAFWMTDNELAAEELLTRTFCRVFAATDSPTSEEIDRALISELRLETALGVMTLQCAPCDRTLSVRNNTLRVDLERAVVQLPKTERIIFLMHDLEFYGHARIARTLGLTEDQSRSGLHQARLRLRELLAK